MSLPIFTCTGGQIVLPPRNLVLTDRASGGNLIVNPPRKVWERSELSAEEFLERYEKKLIDKNPFYKLYTYTIYGHHQKQIQG